MKVVDPKYISGWAFSLHPDGPKFDVVCGECGGHFKYRVPSIPYPKTPCPACGTLNRIPVEPA